MGKVAVMELGDIELGRHATAQLREYFDDIEKRKVEDILEIPYLLDKKLQNVQGIILLIDSTEQKYVEQTVDKVWDIEIDHSKPVQKLIVQKQDESRQVFRERAQEAARENAEILTEKITG